MMDTTRFLYLLGRYEQGAATDVEVTDLLAFFSDPANEPEIEKLLVLALDRTPADYAPDPPRWQPVIDRILGRTTIEEEGRESAEPMVVPISRGRARRRNWAAAAAILFLLGTGAWWIWNSRHPHQPPVAQTTQPADIPAPATNRATITLGNGRQVYLDSAANGALAQQGSAQVMKLANGQVAYSTGAEPLDHATLLYNTLTNPRGSQIISLTLTDGTKVWLNAESSLRYPVAFTGPDRTVEITGEAYFEVARNPSQPFRVAILPLSGESGEEVEVLGTSFNINAYVDEEYIKTTLLEGLVKVSKGSASKLVKPGEQARTADHGNPLIPRIMVQTADTAQVVAWKNGLFAFKDADLPAVMRQLARWYNIDVTYEGKIPEEKFKFNGKISKDLTLTGVLDLLTNARVHYTLEAGNKLVIRP